MPEVVIQKSRLKALLDVLREMGKDLTFHFKPDGLSFATTDIRQHAMLHGAIPPEWFEEYHVDEDHAVRPNLKIVIQMVKKLKGDVTLTWDDETLFLSSPPVKFSTGQVHPDIVPEPPELKDYGPTTAYQFDAGDFFGAANAGRVLDSPDGGRVDFKVSEGGLKMVSGDVVEGVECEVEAIESSGTFDYTCSYSNDLLALTGPLFEDRIWVKFAQDMPLSITDDVFTVVIAPRIES